MADIGNLFYSSKVGPYPVVINDDLSVNIGPYILGEGALPILTEDLSNTEGYSGYWGVSGYTGLQYDEQIIQIGPFPADLLTMEIFSDNVPATWNFGITRPPNNTLAFDYNGLFGPGLMTYLYTSAGTGEDGTGVTEYYVGYYSGSPIVTLFRNALADDEDWQTLDFFPADLTGSGTDLMTFLGATQVKVILGTIGPYPVE